MQEVREYLQENNTVYFWLSLVGDGLRRVFGKNGTSKKATLTTRENMPILGLEEN